MTKGKENSAMVSVMFACFMLMFAVTAMDIKKNMARRGVLRPSQISAGVSLEVSRLLSAGRLPTRLPAATIPKLKEADMPVPLPMVTELAVVPADFWESAAGIHDGKTTESTAARIDILPLQIDEEDSMHP